MAFLGIVWPKLKAIWTFLMGFLRIFEAAKLLRENGKLRSQINECRAERDNLAEQLDFASKIEPRGVFLYLKSPRPGYDEGPYCRVCWEREEKLLSVQSTSKRQSDGLRIRKTRIWVCPSCQNAWHAE